MNVLLECFNAAYIEARRQFQKQYPKYNAGAVLSAFQRCPRARGDPRDISGAYKHVFGGAETDEKAQCSQCDGFLWRYERAIRNYSRVMRD